MSHAVVDEFFYHFFYHYLHCVGRATEVSYSSIIVLARLLKSAIAPLQRVQIAAVRIICNLGQHGRVTTAPYELHWLPVKQCVTCNLFLCTSFMPNLVLSAWLNQSRPRPPALHPVPDSVLGAVDAMSNQQLVSSWTSRFLHSWLCSLELSSHITPTQNKLNIFKRGLKTVFWSEHTCNSISISTIAYYVMVRFPV